jgi:hypothetical protein
MEQYVSAWKKEYNISEKTERRLRGSQLFLYLFLVFADMFYLVIDEDYNKRWKESKFRRMEDDGRIPVGYRKNLRTNWFYSKFIFKELHYWRVDKKMRFAYQGFGVFYINQKIREFESLQRLSRAEKKGLMNGQEEGSAYLHGFGYHLFLKPFSLYTDTISIGGVIVLGTWEPLLIMLIMPFCRFCATLVVWVQEKLKGHKTKLGIAFVVGSMPKIGIFGFPLQMYHNRREFFWLISSSSLSGMGRKIPVFGELNSTVEHWFMRRNPVKLTHQ